MSKDNAFFTSFRNSILEEKANPDVPENSDDRISFQMHHFDMIPANARNLIKNMTRSNPTPPIYAFLALGMIGTNIARHSVIRRVGANRDQAERSGVFYKFIAPSRVGKGIALSLITQIGAHVESHRKAAYDTRLSNELRVDQEGNQINISEIELKSSALRPHSVFLTGANGLQTQALAAANAGCGLINVPEIKSGKARYTDAEGTYAPILTFFDKPLGSNSYRKADTIPEIENCRIQIVAAGVKEDWAEFATKAGATSGALARVLPVLAFDREMIRLQNERLPAYTFNLDGIKEAFEVLEDQFAEYTAEDIDPPITLEFSESRIMREYRNTNSLLISQYRGEDEANMRAAMKTLLDHPPPNTDKLLEEGSGSAQVNVFMTQIRAEFRRMSQNPGNENALNGIENNLLRVASDFFWASYIADYLTEDGMLTAEKKVLLTQSIKDHTDNKFIIFPDEAIKPLLKFMRYTLIGSAHLNKFTSGIPNEVPVLEPLQAASNKRKRIIERLSEGLTGAKRRRFPLSRVKEALRAIQPTMIENQVRILESHAIVSKPSNRTVELVRRFSERARVYMSVSCDLTEQEIVTIEENMTELQD